MNENYIIGITLSDKQDYSMMVVVKREEGKPTVNNVFIGEEAEEKYELFKREFCKEDRDVAK